MRFRRAIFLSGPALVAALLLSGCGNKSGDAESEKDKAPALTAATLGEQQVMAVNEYLDQPRYAKANRRNGERQAQICRACHSLDAGGPNMVGPGLYGFFGKPVGSVEGFGYSPVMRNADFVWTPRALDAWLAQPGRFLPGNRMTFAGVMRQEDRDDLIAWLLEETSSQD